MELPKIGFSVSKALTAPFFINIKLAFWCWNFQSINQIRISNYGHNFHSLMHAIHSNPLLAASSHIKLCAKSNYRQFESEIGIEIHVLVRNWTLTFRIFPLCIQLCTHIRHYRSSEFNAWEFRTTSAQQVQKKVKRRERKKTYFLFRQFIMHKHRMLWSNVVVFSFLAFFFSSSRPILGSSFFDGIISFMPGPLKTNGIFMKSVQWKERMKKKTNFLCPKRGTWDEGFRILVWTQRKLSDRVQMRHQNVFNVDATGTTLKTLHHCMHWIWFTWAPRQPKRRTKQKAQHNTTKWAFLAEPFKNN